MLYRQIFIYFFIRDSPLITTGFKNHPDLKNNNKMAWPFVQNYTELHDIMSNMTFNKLYFQI